MKGVAIKCSQEENIDSLIQSLTDTDEIKKIV